MNAKMMRMQDTLRSFRLTLLSVWVVLSIAGIVYARFQHIPAAVAAAVIPAFLVEASFFLAPGFESAREWIERRLPPRRLAFGLALSAVLPYCLYSLPAGVFRGSALALLAMLTLAISFWYVLLPRTPAADLAFLGLMAGVVIAKVFSGIYVDPARAARMEILGHLMWVRLGIMVMLSLRRVKGTGFGFLPLTRDWRIGVLHYLYFLPVGLPLALAIGLMRFHPVELSWWKALPVAIATFLGMLWVVALSEEFFFRGLLQRWLSRWLDSERVGLLIASLLFGLAHLPFRSFPNWKFAAVAAVAGWFYGRAYAQAKSIRAAMVAHALVNTTTRMLFS